jgi:hypothetical protein
VGLMLAVGEAVVCLKVRNYRLRSNSCISMTICFDAHRHCISLVSYLAFFSS